VSAEPFVFQESMRDELVTELAESALTPSTPLTRRDCFSVALLTLIEHCGHPGARLVHGWVSHSFAGEPCIQHAWVETPARATYEDGSEGEITVVVDYTQPDPRARILPAEVFYLQTQARDCRRFDKAAAVRNALTHRVDGPWPL
jgi:hypothetical protein